MGTDVISGIPLPHDYSQAGEAAIIRDLLARLPRRDRHCVDVGAGDGQTLSNVRHLVEDYNYAAVLIEEQADKVEQARLLCGHNSVIQARVGFEPTDNLDIILSVLTDIPMDFDLLSIDIDGNDYHVWKALAAFRPKLVCIEFNPTIATEVHFIQPADMTVHQGSSLFALVLLGKQKGYELAAVTAFNAVFVDAVYFHHLGITNNDPRLLRKNLSHVTSLFTGYDGTVFLVGNERLPWHPIWWNTDRFQVLPKRLRKYPGHYTHFERWLYNTWATYKRFSVSCRRIIRMKQPITLRVKVLDEEVRKEPGQSGWRKRK